VRIRKYYVDQALYSYDSLIAILQQLTLDEVLHALELESETRRRKTIMSRLIGKASRLQGQALSRALRQQYGRER
jgi:hypothetical protein